MGWSKSLGTSNFLLLTFLSSSETKKSSIISSKHLTILPLLSLTAPYMVITMMSLWHLITWGIESIEKIHVYDACINLINNHFIDPRIWVFVGHVAVMWPPNSLLSDTHCSSGVRTYCVWSYDCHVIKCCTHLQCAAYYWACKEILQNFKPKLDFFANFCEGLFLIRLEELVKKEGVAFHASDHSPSSITPLTINCFIINHSEYHFSKSSMVSFELLSISWSGL